MPAPALVIFDCDGVLIDSEVIASRVLGECLVAAAFPTTVAEAMEIGIGKNRITLAAAVESRFGRKLPDGFFEGMRAEILRSFARELVPMPGIAALLASLPMPCCVASNSHIDRVRSALAMTGLLQHFDPHVFSATMVAQGKPAPDLFLLAASRLGVMPENCLVIEDSVTGVAAAGAAHMPVIGFCGGSHCRDGHADRLLSAGCTQVFARMSDVAAFLDARPPDPPVN